MTYATVMVHLKVGESNSAVLQVAGDLADALQAAVIGIAAFQPLQIAYDGAYVPGDLYQANREELDKEVRDAEAEFRRALAGRVDTIDWRSATMCLSLSDYVAHEARSADLIITGVDPGGFMIDTSRRLDTGALVMQAGKPVLVVPPAAGRLRLEKIVIGWKETRETRRAASDALPLLKKATDVAIVEIAAEDKLEQTRARLQDVAGWLKRHGVSAQPIAIPTTGDDLNRLKEFAQDYYADLVVVGAYGHSRMREWALGGVTRGILMHTDRCSLVAH